MEPDILHKIIENKKLELKILKSTAPLSSFKSKIKPSTRNFKKAISKNGMNLIAEIKSASPSAGSIASVKPVKLAMLYNNYADAISVITEKKFFKGSIRYLKQINKLTRVPLLRKDFIIDEYQIYESRHYGADAILLIASLLDKAQIDKFIETARTLGMDCIVEVHDKAELDTVLKTKAEIIGINNRNLNTFKVDLNATLNLLKFIPKTKVVVSESGFNNSRDINKVRNKVNAVLIGTSIIRSQNIEEKLKELIIPKIKLCGITTLEDARLASELGATYLGFIFYKKSPRYITIEKAEPIIKELPDNVLKVGVFVNETIGNIKKAVKQLRLDCVQLHGTESADYCSKLSIPIIKAFHVNDKGILTDNIASYKTDYYLFDTYTSKYGGSGRSFDWNLIKESYGKNKCFLSGGLNAVNIKEAYSLKPYCLDIGSGVELKPGVKSAEKLNELFNIINRI